MIFPLTEAVSEAAPVDPVAVEAADWDVPCAEDADVSVYAAADPQPVRIATLITDVV